MIRSMPVLQVRDVKRSEAFYCEKLGFRSLLDPAETDAVTDHIVAPSISRPPIRTARPARNGTAR